MSHPTRHLVIDIETLATDVNAVVTQVGWVVIDVSPEGVATVADIPNDWRCGSTNLKYGAQIQSGRTFDPATFQWWLRQDRDVFASVVDQTHAIHHEALLVNLTEIRRICSIDSVWAYGASFDFAILRSLWNNTTPWAYKAERCARTIARVYNQKGSGHTTHRAIEDAQQTAEMLVRLHNDPSNSFVIQ